MNVVKLFQTREISLSLQTAAFQTSFQDRARRVHPTPSTNLTRSIINPTAASLAYLTGHITTAPGVYWRLKAPSKMIDWVKSNCNNELFSNNVSTQSKFSFSPYVWPIRPDCIFLNYCLEKRHFPILPYHQLPYFIILPGYMILKWSFRDRHKTPPHYNFTAFSTKHLVILLAMVIRTVNIHTRTTH